MDLFILLLFVATYAGMAVGRLPGLKIDRTGIALVAAVLIVATGALPGRHVTDAVHFPTLLLLAGLMVLSARFRAAGLYDLAAAWVSRRAGRPMVLLALTIAVSGALSAVLVNDIVVFAMAPLLCRSLIDREIDPRPYLFAMAAASNAGSAATLIGNPQNILIGQIGGLSFWGYSAAAIPPTLFALLATFLCIAAVWRKSLRTVPSGEAPPAIEVAPRSVAVSVGALVLLLALFLTPLPREVSALLVAGAVMVSRTVPSRQLLDEIDVSLLILFASLFVVTAALTSTGLPEALVQHLARTGLSPERTTFLLPFSLAASNSIGNVPAVILLLRVWPDLPANALTALALYATFAGNLLLIGSLANLIVAERAATCGLRLTFLDHAKAGIPITLISVAFTVLWAGS